MPNSTPDPDFQVEEVVRVTESKQGLYENNFYKITSISIIGVYPWFILYGLIDEGGGHHSVHNLHEFAVRMDDEGYNQEAQR